MGCKLFLAVDPAESPRLTARKMNRFWPVALSLGLGLAGCVALPAPPAPPAAPPQVRLMPDVRPYGRIAMVNPQGQFVVVDFNVGVIPALPVTMNVYRDNTVVGVVRLNGPVRDGLVAGDLVTGEAVVGDRAILDPAGERKPVEPDP